MFYPIHFLDFETHNSALPKYDGIYPYANIPFQFSCHKYHESGTLEHTEFLAIENILMSNQTYKIKLIFAGDGIITFFVEEIDALLDDLGQPWTVKKVPIHKI